ncbi:MAG: RagB/SusD family nutrient uptake outer membrane protein [Mucilaginibacter sp.]|nr:RagB/SusD family nutrient uptake outer membrane protein [Mucilaginibacter sp.]
MDPKQVSGGVKGTYNAKYELYPIPLAQIQTNPKLTQNPGY